MTTEATGDLWLVLGASSSVARAFARQVAADGADLLLAGRDAEDLARTAADIAVRTGRRAGVLVFDAAAPAGHDSVVEACRSRGGRLNLFLAFGAMPAQAEIDGDPSLAEQVVAVNYTGAMSILSRLAPLLESQKAGRVVVLSSVAGDRGRPKNYVYGSAKAGLNVYLQGLRARLFRSGVTVTTVKPGFLDTAMTFGLPGMFLVGRPEACARACLAAAKRGREILYFPAFWRPIMAIIRAIPEPLFKRLDI